jgi:hypothetical protein
MPHTRAWVVTDPAGSVQAKQIDDEMRKLRVDIDERWADIMLDTTADPVDLKPQFKGNVVGKQLILPYSDFNSSTTGKETYYQAGYGQAFTDTGPLVAGIKLSPGCTITLVEVLVDKGDANSVEFDFYTRSFAAGAGRPGSQTAQVSQAHIANVAAGVVLMTSGVIAIAVDNAHLYYIVIEGIGPAGNSFDFYGARITYTVPDCRNTV